MLTGQDLLAFVAKNCSKGLSERELARQAGYVRETQRGEQILTKSFNRELHRANGVTVTEGRGPGKAAEYVTTVHKAGQVLVGRHYIEQVGWEPGTVLDISVDTETNTLCLSPSLADDNSAE